jgi:hypothetical protein
MSLTKIAAYVGICILLVCAYFVVMRYLDDVKCSFEDKECFCPPQSECLAVTCPLCSCPPCAVLDEKVCPPCQSCSGLSDVERGWLLDYKCSYGVPAQQDGCNRLLREVRDYLGVKKMKTFNDQNVGNTYRTYGSNITLNPDNTFTIPKYRKDGRDFMQLDKDSWGVNITYDKIIITRYKT